MLRRFTLFSALVVVAFLTPVSSAWAGQVAGVGKHAPDFTLNFQGGGSASLSDYQGQVVLLMMIGYL